MSKTEKTDSKGKRKKILLVTLIVLLALFILIWIYKIIILSFATVVVRYDFTGIENMFHAKYEYHAVAGPFHAKVPKGMVEMWYPDSDIDKSIYDDEENQYYYVQLQYCDGGEPRPGDGNIPLSHGSEYVLTYSKWTKKSQDMSEKAKQTALNAIEKLYDFDKGFSKNDKWVWNSGGCYGVESFMLITHGNAEDRCVLNTSLKDAVYTFDGQKLVKIMKVPKNGNWDYTYFIDR